MRLRASVWISLGYVALLWTLFAVGVWASGHSYAVWASAGIVAAVLMLLGAAASLFVLVAAAFTQSGRLAVPGAILAGGCALPLLLILAGGLILDL